MWVNSNFIIVREAVEGNSAVKLAGQLKPDVVIMDNLLRGQSTVEVTLSIKTLCPAVCVIGFAFEAKDEWDDQMRQAGTAATLDKGVAPYQLLTVMRNSVAEARKRR